MAANVILLALPNTPTFYDLARRAVGELPDDERLVVIRTTLRLMRVGTCASVWIGPIPIVREYWSTARRLTRGQITSTLVLLNQPTAATQPPRRRRTPIGGRPRYTRTFAARHARPRDLKRWLYAQQGKIVWAEVW